MRRISIYFLYFLLLSIVIYLFRPDNSDKDSSIEKMSLEEEIANDLKRNPGFTTGLTMEDVSKEILEKQLKAQGKTFEKYINYFVPVAAGITEKTLDDYISSGSNFIKDRKSFISGPRPLTEISDGVFIDREIYRATGQKVIFKNIKSNMDDAGLFETSTREGFTTTNHTATESTDRIEFIDNP